jgi:hypothetical protein
VLTTTNPVDWRLAALKLASVIPLLVWMFHSGR